MKHFLVLSLFFLSCVITKGNTISFKTIPHSNVLLFQKINQDSIVLLKTKNRIKNFARAQKYDSAIFYSRKLLNLSRKISDSTYLEEANFRLGYYYKTTGHLEEAFTHYNNSFKILRDISDSTSAASRLASMANIQKGLGDYVGSKITAVDGLNYLKNNLNFKRTSSLQHIISVCFRELKDYQSALRWNEKALVTLKNTEEDIPYTSLVVIKNTRANILSNQKKYVESLSTLSGLMTDSLIVNNQKEYARLLSNLGYVKWLENKNNSVSDSLLQKAFLIREQIDDSQGLIASCIHLTQYYFDSDKSKALRFAEYAYSNARKRNSLPAIIESFGYIFQLKKDVNEEAKIYHEVNEKLKRVNQKNRETYAVTKFENDKLIEDNIKKDKQVLIEKNQKTKYLLGFIAICFLVLLGGYFFIQRTKSLKKEKESAALKAIHETEAELSRRLHDDFGGKLNNAMVMLQNKTSVNEVLDVVDELYNQSRNFSREINVVDTGEHFEEELLEMLRFRTPSDSKLIHSGITAIKWSSIAPIKKTTLFKVLQELMINMGKYSNATLIIIGFSATSKTLKVDYVDDGDGATNKELQTKNGLRNTEKRIRALKGSITFDSEKGNGFRAEIKIPK
jgi:signal transduction histidine kinase